MTSERWQQLKQIFQSALERTPAERSAFLNQVCAGGEALRISSAWEYDLS